MSTREDEAKVAWLASEAVPLLSLDPAFNGEDDLEAIGPLFDGVRVVMLGEQSHSEGTTFLAKTRLIKFLHERLGFDVLA